MPQGKPQPAKQLSRRTRNEPMCVYRLGNIAIYKEDGIYSYVDGTYLRMFLHYLKNDMYCQYLVFIHLLVFVSLYTFMCSYFIWGTSRCLVFEYQQVGIIWRRQNRVYKVERLLTYAHNRRDSLCREIWFLKCRLSRQVRRHEECKGLTPDGWPNKYE